MNITPQDAFKLGFLARCAEERLTGAALDARLEKVAEFNKRAAPGAGGSAPVFKWNPIAYDAAAAGLGQRLWEGLSMAWAIPPAAAIMGGSALGYGAAKAVEPQTNDDEIKAQELADTYKLYAEKAKARRKMRKYRLGQGAS